MRFLKTGTVIPGIALCYLSLCVAGPVAKGEAVGATALPLFEPGKEYHVETDNEAIGTKSSIGVEGPSYRLEYTRTRGSYAAPCRAYILDNRPAEPEDTGLSVGPL